MKCPIDQTALVRAERQGVEIDYCPECRGVWLDRGELDKIVERSVSSPEARRAERSAKGDDPAPRRKDGDSFLEDIFDF